MILDRLRYPGGSSQFFAYSGALTPTSITREIRSRDSVSNTSLPRFGRRSSVVRAVERFTLIWSGLDSGEVRLLLHDYENAASRGARRLSYTPDDRSDPVDVFVRARPSVTRTSATAWTVSLVLEVQA